MAGAWDNVFATGIEWQDRHHKELFGRMDRLADAMKRGCGASETAPLLTFLEQYFAYHFKAEEEEMRRFDYPDAAAHADQHNRFMARMARIRGACPGGPSAACAVRVRTEMIDWFAHHVGSADQVLALFLRKNGEGAKHARASISPSDIEGRFHEQEPVVTSRRV